MIRLSDLATVEVGATRKFTMARKGDYLTIMAS